MQSVVSDRGSFTIEASLVCTFIVIIVMNVVILLLQIFEIDYYYNGENLEVDINYGYKGYARSILSRLINVDNNYNFHRKFKLISICDNVRGESNVQP